MKVKTSAAVGRLLDWAVARSVNIELPGVAYLPPAELLPNYLRVWSPSARYENGGPLIELFGVSTECFSPHDENVKEWTATLDGEYRQHGPTILIAAMRSLAALHFGEEIEVPRFLSEEDI
jgi:hypothetical protein